MRSHVKPLHATLSMFQEDVILFRVDQVAIDFFFWSLHSRRDAIVHFKSAMSHLINYFLCIKAFLSLYINPRCNLSPI